MSWPMFKLLPNKAACQPANQRVPTEDIDPHDTHIDPKSLTNNVRLQPPWVVTSNWHVCHKFWETHIYILMGLSAWKSTKTFWTPATLWYLHILIHIVLNSSRPVNCYTMIFTYSHTHHPCSLHNMSCNRISIWCILAPGFEEGINWSLLFVFPWLVALALQALQKNDNIIKLWHKVYLSLSINSRKVIAETIHIWHKVIHQKQKVLLMEGCRGTELHMLHTSSGTKLQIWLKQQCIQYHKLNLFLC